MDLIHGVQKRWRYRRGVGGQIFFQLGQGGGADDGAGDAPAPVAEGQGQLGEAQMVAGRQFLVGGHGFLHIGFAVALSKAGEQIDPPRSLGIGQILAAQQAKGQGGIGQQAHLFPIADFRQGDVEHPVHQVIGVLEGHHPGQAHLVRQAEELHQPPGVFVGDPHIADFPRLHQVRQGGQGFP